MERVVQELVSYRSVDGKTFPSEEACRHYERGLPRTLFYRLSYPDRVATSKTGAFAYGYVTVTHRTEHESPGFLRAGGDYTVEDHTDTVLGIALGSYDAVMQHAVAVPEFWAAHRTAFIREIAFADLRAPDGANR